MFRESHACGHEPNRRTFMRAAAGLVAVGAAAESKGATAPVIARCSKAELKERLYDAANAMGVDVRTLVTADVDATVSRVEAFQLELNARLDSAVDVDHLEANRIAREVAEKSLAGDLQLAVMPFGMTFQETAHTSSAGLTATGSLTNTENGRPDADVDVDFKY